MPEIRYVFTDLHVLVDQHLPHCLQLRDGFLAGAQAERWLTARFGASFTPDARFGNPCCETPTRVFLDSQWMCMSGSRFLFTRDAAIIARLECDLFEPSDAE